MSLKNLFLSEKSELETFRLALRGLLTSYQLKKDDVVKWHIARIKELYSEHNISPFEYFYELNEEREGRKSVYNRSSTGRVKHPGKNRPVLQLDMLTGKTIKEHPSLKEAAISLGAHSSNIGYCARGEIKTAYGFKWIFKDELEATKPNKTNTINGKGIY